MVMDFLQRPIPLPESKVTVHRALRRKVIRQVPSRAAGFQYVLQRTVDPLPEVHRALAPTPLRDERPDQCPLRVRQINRVSKPSRRYCCRLSTVLKGHPQLSTYSLSL